MQLQSKIKYSNLPLNTQYEYELSAMGATAQAHISFFEDERGRQCFHLSSTAQIKLLNLEYHFECMSRWENENGELIFDSYEEKDFSKNIRKKWEINSEGLNYIEDKKGLILEREVVYFADDIIENIYDPLSAVLQFTLQPLIDGHKREVCVFGKQRVIKVIATKQNDTIEFQPVDGMNSLWSKLVSNLSLKISNDGIEEAKVPSPLAMGNLTLKKKERYTLVDEKSQEILKKFNS